jgi:hypothetical protein
MHEKVQYYMSLNHVNFTEEVPIHPISLDLLGKGVSELGDLFRDQS